MDMFMIAFIFVGVAAVLLISFKLLANKILDWAERWPECLSTAFYFFIVACLFTVSWFSIVKWLIELCGLDHRFCGC